MSQEVLRPLGVETAWRLCTAAILLRVSSYHQSAPVRCVATSDSQLAAHHANPDLEDILNKSSANRSCSHLVF